MRIIDRHTDQAQYADPGSFGQPITNWPSALLLSQEDAEAFAISSPSGRSRHKRSEDLSSVPMAQARKHRCSRALLPGLRGLRQRHGLRAKDRVHCQSRLVLTVRPEVRVAVQRLGCRCMAESCLHDLDRLAVTDQQAGVVVPERVEPGPCWQSGPLDGGTPDSRRERRTPKGIALSRREHEPRCGEGCEMRRKLIHNDLWKRHGPVARGGLGRTNLRGSAGQEHQLLLDYDLLAQEVNVPE